MTNHIYITESTPREGTTVAKCPDHPDAPSTGGFGLAGGGFGPYEICDVCGRLFGKVVVDDDED